MQQQVHRDMFSDLYRIYEKYEIVPNTTEERDTYFKSLLVDLNAYYDKYERETVAVRLSFGLLEGLTDAADAKGERIKKAEQVAQQMEMQLDRLASKQLTKQLTMQLTS